MNKCKEHGDEQLIKEVHQFFCERCKIVRIHPRHAAPVNWSTSNPDSSKSNKNVDVLKLA